jgi:hypothetical protein
VHICGSKAFTTKDAKEERRSQEASSWLAGAKDATMKSTSEKQNTMNREGVQIFA